MRRAMLIGVVFGAIASRGLAQAVDTLPHVTISIDERRPWVVAPTRDTLFTAPVSLASGRTLRSDGRSWVCLAPRGETIARGKGGAPLWSPPDWQYVELAHKLGLHTTQLA